MTLQWNNWCYFRVRDKLRTRSLINKARQRMERGHFSISAPFFLIDDSGRCDLIVNSLSPPIYMLLFVILFLSVPGGCFFPERWEGSWFQSGVRQPIIIEGPRLSSKGRCIGSEGDKFLVVDEYVNFKFNSTRTYAQFFFKLDCQVKHF